MAAVWVDPYPVLARQGYVLSSILYFLAALACTVIIIAGSWPPGSAPSYKVASLSPGLVAALLAALIGPRLWQRLVVDGERFSFVKGMVSGVLSVALVHLVTAELFLAIFFGFLRYFEPASPYLGEYPGLVLMAPLLSFRAFGLLTLPLGMVIGGGVAVYCQRLLRRSQMGGR